MRIGVVGTDTSHFEQFAGRIQASNRAGLTTCRVTHCCRGQADANPRETELCQRLDIQPVGSVESLLASVDAVMILLGDGHQHHDVALAAISRSLPTFVDKPLTCSVDEALSLLALSRSKPARCYAASALRFLSDTPLVLPGAVGRIVAIDAFGPIEETRDMKGLWYYGCHTLELVDSLWGGSRGVERVRARELTDRYVLDLHYPDGRGARVRLERGAAGDFGATAHGTTGVYQAVFDLRSAYDRLVASMIGFFEGGDPGVPLASIVENIAVIEAAHASAQASGRWVPVRRVPG